ncbi:hypothetical protein Pmar_PMAR026376 [Perkinsus marinus ATCC 50983]|uniref:Uncharacterized protein n=1 Tax=Perkinsus marinus (strain ATCC 50983 / TXsc) TaxID=423536 RepID=C5LEK6_PERM5|nr:hypothetical protein Pmar_PMAR026376 [Perkinsus marinus ATCC 50983]EER04824.1 hypothetical protein Pmar_PMAR026376 [Perkinsus marinus ATCC 50983]|eukprot:XP_002773008.1 hypothetical protein Pmar_PMAR026376 [Perkinsus marinus ATCC 50983]
MFVRISIATIALTSLAEGIVVDRPSGDEKPLFGSFDDMELTPEAINLLKEYEADLIKQDEERIASYSGVPQLAAVSADGSFSYPPGCTPKMRPEGKYYCFHGKRNTTGTGKEVTAIVDVFDIKDPQDNVVIGFTAKFEDNTARTLRAHAGGDANIVAFGRKTRLGATISLATYDLESPKPGLLGRLEQNMVADPHFKVYVLNYQAMDIEHVPSRTSYVYATNGGNMGFNVTASITQDVKLGTVGGSLHLTLDTLKGNDSVWDLKGTAKAFANNFLLKLNFPATFLQDRIVLPK